jgi:hypothetical protein
MDEENVAKVNSSVSVCSYGNCGQPAVKICPQCGQDFCETHECMMHSKPLETKREPILDEDGAPRHGERIALVGEGWPDRIRMVDQMTDDELVGYITEHQRRLDRARKDSDYEQITIAHANYVLGARQHSRYIAAIRRREKREALAGVINLGKNKTKGQKQIPPDIVALMKLPGIDTYEKAVAMKSVLGALRKK